MTSPFDQFRTRSTFNGSENLLRSAVENMQDKADTNPIDDRSLAQLFLSAQAELLAAKGTTLSLVSSKDAGVGLKSAGLYDGYANTLTLTADNLGVDVARTAAHEMTHGIERTIMEGRTEAKIALMLTTDPLTKKEKTQEDITSIYNAIQSALPADASKIQSQFKAQVSSGEGRTKIVPLEIGAYSNEALFHEIRATGGVDQFVTRYQNIGQDELQKVSIRGRNRASKALTTAQEIVAVSVYDINNHIISHLQSRNTPDDMELASKLIKVKNTIEPAYLSAQRKYGPIFPELPQQQQAQASEATQSAQHEPEPSLSYTSTVAASSSDHSASSATLHHASAKDIHMTLSSNEISSSVPGNPSSLGKTSVQKRRTQIEDPHDAISSSNVSTSLSSTAIIRPLPSSRDDDSSHSDSPSGSPQQSRSRRTTQPIENQQTIEPSSAAPQIKSSLPPPTATQVAYSQSNGDITFDPSHLINQHLNPTVEDNTKPFTPMQTPTPRSSHTTVSIEGPVSTKNQGYSI